jgi:hypothetical protein
MFNNWFGDRTVLPPAPKPTVRFSNPVGSDFETWKTLVGMYSSATVSRKQAMSIPAVVAARDKLCSLGSVLPIHAFNGDGTRISRPLLSDPESSSGPTRAKSMEDLIDDLFFYGRSLWRVVDRDFQGYPTSVKRIPHGRWNIDETTDRVMVDGEKINFLDAVVFLSPREGLLSKGGGTLSALIALEAVAALRINQPQAIAYFRTTNDADLSEDEIQDFLTDIVAARKANAVGFLPNGVEIAGDGQLITGEQMQLMEARNFSVLEVCRLTGMNPYWLGVNVTSRTYANISEERRDFVDTVARPYLASIEQRLSKPDVTPNTQRVLWNLDAYLRADTKTRYECHAIGLAAGFLTVNEIRTELENLPPLPGGDTPKVTESSQ